MKCINCKVENNQKNGFCTSCGTRLDGKTSCSKCNEVVELTTKFCPKCGSKIKKVKQGNIEKKPNISAETSNFLDKLASCFGLIAIILSFIFMVFIGVKLTGEIGLSYSSQYGLTDLINEIFSGEFFETTSGIDNYMFGQIFGVLIAFGFMIAMLVSIVFTVIMYCKRNKDQKYLTKFMKWSLVTFFAYILYVIAFHLLFAFNVTYETSELTYGVGYTLNEATIAGIIITSITMLISLVFYGISKFKGINKKYILNSIRTLIILAFTFTGLILISRAILTTQETITQLDANVYTTYGIYYFFRNVSGDDIFSSILIGVAALSILAFMVIFTLMIKDLLIDFGEDKTKRITRYAFTLGVLLTAISILEIYTFAINTAAETYSASYALPIATMVIGELFIIFVVLSNRFLNGANREQKEAKK